VITLSRFHCAGELKKNTNIFVHNVLPVRVMVLDRGVDDGGVLQRHNSINHHIIVTSARRDKIYIKFKYKILTNPNQNNVT
jgi:hypothetical protein